AAARFSELSTYPINERVMHHPVIIKGRSVSVKQVDEMARWLRSLGAAQLSRQGWFPRFGERGYRVAPELEVRTVVSKRSTHVVVTEDGYGTLEGPLPDCDFSGEA